MKIKNLFGYLLVLYGASLQALPNSIILFIDKYPTIKGPKEKKLSSSLSEKLKQPGYLYKKILKKKYRQSGMQGVMGMYLGYATLSDQNGQMIFPRKQQRPTINILITQGIQPVYMVAPATLHNWMLDEKKSSELYQCTFNKDQETQLYYIQTEKIPLPHDLMIPLNTIIIIADPENFYIPRGATITNYAADLILPTIYVKKNFNFARNVLYTNAIKQYFDTVQTRFKSEDLAIASLTE